MKRNQESRWATTSPAHASQWVLTDLSHTAAWRLLVTEGNTADVLVSDDSVAGHTLGYTE